MRFKLLTTLESFRMVLAVVIVFVFPKASESCQCPNATRLEKFCESDFSLIGRPVGKFLTEDRNSTVHVIQVHLSNHLQYEEGPRYIELESPISLLHCGMQLNIGIHYVFNAIFLDGIRGRITKCGWNEKWTDVPEPLKALLLQDSILCPEYWNQMH